MNSIDDRFASGNKLIAMVAVFGLAVAGLGVFASTGIRKKVETSFVGTKAPDEFKLDIDVDTVAKTATPDMLTVTFGLNDAARAITPDVAKNIRALAMHCPGTLDVQGHTCTLGTPEQNEAIAHDRAKATAAVLVQMGVPSDRLRVSSAGSRDPVADNATDTGRRLNRRVTLRCALDSNNQRSTGVPK